MNHVTFVCLQVLSSSDDRYGYNAAKDRYEDLISAGILDPSKVVFQTFLIILNLHSMNSIC